MSRKTDLISALHDYGKIYENAQAQVKQFRESHQYSEEGKKERIQSITKRLASETQIYHDKVIKLIDDGLAALVDTWKKNSTEKLTDGGYQAGLANVIKMFEMGAICYEEDIKNIIDTYSGDFNALAVIRQILVNSDNKTWNDCIASIPEDKREKNKELLMQLRSNVNTYINENMIQSILNDWKFNYGLTGVAMSLDGMIQFVSDRLGDNLELLN